jgi:L-serine dehydratase
MDDFNVHIRGDAYELLLKKNGTDPFPETWDIEVADAIKVDQYAGRDGRLLHLKSPDPFSSDFIDRITGSGSAGASSGDRFYEVILINPVLPVLSGKEKDIPFKSIPSMLLYADRENLDLGALGMLYEESRSGLTRQVLTGKMEKLVKTIENSIRRGLDGTVHKDRILHRQSHLLRRAEKEGIIPRSIVNEITTCVTAIMEAKSAMEVVVANPTAGSCGTVGGTLKAVADELESKREELVRAYFASGLIGAWFAVGPGFSAEEHGCQVECGAASGMAAAGVVQLMGGTARQAVDAASMAIQNMIGLVCDPVADRVEVPCLGKNISAATNAFSSATMALSGFNAVIPLEEVLETVASVGHQMPACLKCTGKGGLSVTPASLQIKKKLEGGSN